MPGNLQYLIKINDVKNYFDYKNSDKVVLCLCRRVVERYNSSY